MPSNPNLVLASMGIYVFNTPVLIQALLEDAGRDTSHDFGQEHHSESDRDKAGLCIQFQRYESEGGEVLAGRRNARRLFRSEHGPRSLSIRSSIFTTKSGQSEPMSAHIRRPKQSGISITKAASASRSIPSFRKDRSSAEAG